MPAFFDTLHNAPSGAPDLHIAVTTTDMGAGAFTSSVPGCSSPDLGNFITTPRSPQDPTSCTTNRMNNGEHFFKDGATRNYTGDLATAVGCIVQLSGLGCGFRHPLAAARAALGDSQTGIIPPDGNAGFLRANARLAIIFVVEEDDCSVPSNSLLFDPSQTQLSDPLGPLINFRCVEFGITCDGLTANNGRVPRTANTYHNCRSNDAYAMVDPAHSLVPAQTFIDYFQRLKQDVVVAALSGADEPFGVFVDQQTNFPALAASCSSQNAVYGFPSVRLHEVVDSLGARSRFSSVCQASYGEDLQDVADLILTP